MEIIQNSRRCQIIYILLIFCAAGFLFTCNLGNHHLWQDEAQTALISKTILTEGIPRGTDGKNFFSQEIGAEYGENFIWKWHTWLPFYFVAGFFHLFGINEFSARLPFALLGIGTVVLTFYFCKALWEDKRIAYTASFLLLTCIPFLLLSRQCRWYSMSAFFSLWALLAYLKVLESKKHSRWNFVLASTLLFHTHYVYCATLLASVFLHALIFRRDRLRLTIELALIISLLNGPWILWLSGMNYGKRYGYLLFKLKKPLGFAAVFYFLIIEFIFPLYSLLIIPAVALWNRIKTGAFFPTIRIYRPGLSLLLIFIIVNLVTLAIASPYPYIRYLSPIIPILIVLLAVLLVSAAKLHIIIPIAVIAFMLFKNFIPDFMYDLTHDFMSFKNSIPDFMYELTHDFDGPMEGIANYLNEHADGDDIVLITYGDMPLKFYTNLRIVGGLTGESLRVASDPDWIIMRKYRASYLSNRIRNYIETFSISDYEPIVLDCVDTRFENREAPHNHFYRTVTDGQKVVIHRKKTNISADNAGPSSMTKQKQ